MLTTDIFITAVNNADTDFNSGIIDAQERAELIRSLAKKYLKTTENGGEGEYATGKSQMTTALLRVSLKALDKKFRQMMISSDDYAMYAAAYGTQWKQWLAETNSIGHLSTDVKDDVYSRTSDVVSVVMFDDAESFYEAFEETYAKFSVEALDATRL